MVHASATRELAQEKLAEQWDFDRREWPARAQLMLAYTRTDVRVLNELARERMLASGQLGEDRHVRTEHGPRQMAVGDRVLFLRNERGLGVKNGTLGELRSISGSVLEVRLDEVGRRGAGALIRFDLRDYASLDHGYATTIHKSQGTTVGRSYVLASEPMDRHATYVALTRHSGRTDLHYGRDEFGDEDRLAARLGRERAKDTTLDYEAGEPRMARDRDEVRHDPAWRRAEAEHREDTREVIERDIAHERRQPSPEELERHAAARGPDEHRGGATRLREGELIEGTGREGRRDTVLDGDRTNDGPLDDRTRAAVQRIGRRLRAERDAEQQAREPRGLTQAIIRVRDLLAGRDARPRRTEGRGR
jgi:hypothetical protein